MLQDNFGRHHDYLRISITERCNLRCAYCMPEHGVLLTPNEQLMSSREMLEIAEIFVNLGVKKIRVTGGEPLVRKDSKDILLGLSKLPVELTLTTNALLVNNFIDTFQNAGIKSLNVSLDTLREGRFHAITKRNFFNKTLENIQLLIDEGFHVKVNSVLMKGINDDEICDFINWTKDKPVHVRFIEFMPFDGNSWDWNKIIPLKEILDRIKEKFNIIKLLDSQNSTAKAYQVTGFKGTFAVISSMTNHFCGSCNRLRLTANGKMKNCLFSNNEYDLLTPFRKGENITELITNCLSDKKKKHGGIEKLEELNQENSMYSKRSMIQIGG